MNKTFGKAGLILGLVLAPAFVFSVIAQEEGVSAGYAGPDVMMDASATVEIPPFAGGAEPSVVVPVNVQEHKKESAQNLDEVDNRCRSSCSCNLYDGFMNYLNTLHCMGVFVVAMMLSAISSLFTGVPVEA